MPLSPDFYEDRPQIEVLAIDENTMRIRSMESGRYYQLILEEVDGQEQATVEPLIAIPVTEIK